MSPAEGIAAILEGRAIIGGSTGFAPRIGGFFGEGAQVACLDSGGRGGEVKVAIDYPSVQVLVKGPQGQGGYTAGYAKAQQIYDTLQGISQNPAEFPRLVSCVARGYINALGKDENGHPRFSINWQLIVTPAAEGNRSY